MIHIEDRGSYIFILYEGCFDYPQTETMLLEVEALSKATGIARAILDLRQIQGLPTTLQSYQIGIFAIGHIFNRIERAAIVYRPEDFHKFTEDVVVNRGGNLRVFTDYDAALKWLLS